MPQYFVRIELHTTRNREPGGEAYEMLHHAAKDRKLERKLVVTHSDRTDQAEYLPTGLYTIFTSENKETLLERAKAAAASTGFEASVVVGEIAGEMLVDNLKPAGPLSAYR